MKIWGIDTYGSVFKKYHETGVFDKNEIYPYSTEGIGEDILPDNVDFSVIDHFEKVTDKDAAIYTRKLAREEGIFAGNSCGAAIAGLLQLKENFKNVQGHTLELDSLFKTFEGTLNNFGSEHGMANSRARLRMTTLYQVAAANNGIVVGTGNKVEDFGVGFYTKYGDGGVDISPIADCNKTEVWELGKELGILKEIIDAPPTDGLWDDGRTDEGQLGLSYKELEEAMDNENSVNRDKYNSIRSANLHKMEPIPVCKIPN